MTNVASQCPPYIYIPGKPLSVSAIFHTRVTRVHHTGTGRHVIVSVSHISRVPTHKQYPPPVMAVSRSSCATELRSSIAHRRLRRCCHRLTSLPLAVAADRSGMVGTCCRRSGLRRRRALTAAAARLGR